MFSDIIWNVVILGIKKLIVIQKTGVALVRALNESATECRNYHDSYRLLD